MSDRHVTELNASGNPTGEMPETSTDALDESQASEASPRDKEPAALDTESLVKLDPRSWVSVWSDPQFAGEAEALVKCYAGEDASPHIVSLAREVAERQIEHRRVDLARVRLETSLSGKHQFLGEPASFGVLVMAAQRQPQKFSAQVILAIHRDYDRSFWRWMKAREKFDAAVRREGAGHHGAFAAALRRQDSIQRASAKKGQGGAPLR